MMKVQNKLPCWSSECNRFSPAFPLNADLEPGVQQHIRRLQELRGSPAHQGHVQTPGLPGHRRGDGGTAEGCQKPGEYDLLSGKGVCGRHNSAAVTEQDREG